MFHGNGLPIFVSAAQDSWWDLGFDVWRRGGALFMIKGSLVFGGASPQDTDALSRSSKNVIML